MKVLFTFTECQNKRKEVGEKYMKNPVGFEKIISEKIYDENNNL